MLSDVSPRMASSSSSASSGLPSSELLTRADRAKRAIINLCLDTNFHFFPNASGVCPLADSTSGVVGHGDRRPSMEKMVLLAYKASNKVRRRRAEWWLMKRHRGLQAVKLLLNVDAVVKRASQVHETELDLIQTPGVEEEELEKQQHEEKCDSDGFIVVPSIAEAAAAMGLQVRFSIRCFIHSPTHARTLSPLSPLTLEPSHTCSTLSHSHTRIIPPSHARSRCCR